MGIPPETRAGRTQGPACGKAKKGRLYWEMALTGQVATQAPHSTQVSAFT